jgi:hypothetical protein
MPWMPPRSSPLRWSTIARALRNLGDGSTLAPAMGRLTTLHLSRNGILAEGVHHLARALDSRRFTCLANHLGRGAVCELAAALKRNTTLTQLVMLGSLRYDDLEAGEAAL